MTLAPPLLVSVTVCACLAPTITLPKSSLRELSTSWPGVDAVPVPDSASFVAVFDALLAMVSVPLKVPVALGENLMLIVALCPEAMVVGRPGAVKEKYWLEIETLLRVTDAGPEFVAVAVKVLLLPAGTLPKLKVLVSNERVPNCC